MATETDALGTLKTFAHVNAVGDNIGKDINAFVVMMDVEAGTNITASVIEAIDGAGAPRIKAVCHHRTGFREMMSSGGPPAKSALQSARFVLKDIAERAGIEFYKGDAHG
ncbi:MAG: hypothetical protein AAFN79_12285 [Pseudomonadota bacterium]